MKLPKFTGVDAFLLFAVAIFRVFIFAEQPRIYPLNSDATQFIAGVAATVALHSPLRDDYASHRFTLEY